MRASVRTGANVKRLGQMSTAVYARLGSPAKIVNVIIIKGPYNKIMLHWDGLKIFIKLKKYTKVILN